MSRHRVAGAIVVAGTLLFALAPLVRGPAELPVAQHHLLHAVLLAGAVVGAILLERPFLRTARPSPVWLVLAMLAPIFAMLLMWPSEYSFFELHPAGHALEHIGIVALGFLTGFAGQRFAPGIGWAAGASAVLMAVLAAGGFGISPPPAQITVLNSAPPANGTRGATIFTQYCAACHGAGGAGASGPALKNERARKSLHQTVEWIENPALPMPKFYPGVLSAADVQAVATYVQTL